MSQWTHVSGSIRIDGFPQMGIVPNLRALLGTPSTDAFQWDGNGKWVEAKDIPSGSEGSIQWKDIRAGDGLVYVTVAVWGDLRDFGSADTPEIDAWFEKIVTAAGEKALIRAAHLLVEVEGGSRYVLVATDGKVSRIEVPSND